jgi:hypothetical protein
MKRLKHTAPRPKHTTFYSRSESKLFTFEKARNSDKPFIVKNQTTPEQMIQYDY